MNQPNYAVSARAFRPRTFSEVIGQRHIVQTLQNAITRGRIAHAYLFTGTRGVGKTTTARILAKALNCENGPTPDPCLACGNCLEIAAGTSLDVIEIDGASNRGIDNIRELRENVKFAPNKSRYKVYIIDEVHQITRDGFNALLKTLEEPPSHVVFIFATTELHKVPDTILSRCQSFEYRSISQADIVAQLQVVAKSLDVTVSDGAIQLLARRARGSMRDAQSLFDQAAAFGDDGITEDEVKLILGLVDREFLSAVMNAIVAGDRAGLLELAEKLVYAGGDPALFADELSETVRNVTTIKIRPEGLAGLHEDEQKSLANWAAALELDELQRLFEILATVADQMRRSHMPSLNLEMGLLRMADSRQGVSLDTIIDRVATTATRIESQTSPVAMQEPLNPAAPVAEPAHQSEEPPESASFEVVEDTVQNAPDALIAEFISVKPSLIGLFANARAHLSDDALIIGVKNGFEQEQLSEEGLKTEMERIASGHLGRRTRLVVKIDSGPKKKEPELKRQKEKEEQRETGLRHRLVETQIVQDALDIFGADIIDVRTDGGGTATSRG